MLEEFSDSLNPNPNPNPNKLGHVMLEEFSDSLISLNWENVYAKPIVFHTEKEEGKLRNEETRKGKVGNEQGFIEEVKDGIEGDDCDGEEEGVEDNNLEDNEVEVGNNGVHETDKNEEFEMNETELVDKMMNIDQENEPI
jgi:hypothetical protein